MKQINQEITIEEMLLEYVNNKFFRFYEAEECALCHTKNNVSIYLKRDFQEIIDRNQCYQEMELFESFLEYNPDDVYDLEKIILDDIEYRESIELCEDCYKNKYFDKFESDSIKRVRNMSEYHRVGIISLVVEEHMKYSEAIDEHFKKEIDYEIYKYKDIDITNSIYQTNEIYEPDDLFRIIVKYYKMTSNPQKVSGYSLKDINWILHMVGLMIRIDRNEETGELIIYQN